MGAKIKTQKNPYGFKQNRKKYLDQNSTPKKSNAKFPSHENFQKALNDITITNLQIVSKTPKNPYLNQATPKNTCENYPTEKNPEIENLRPEKILRSSLSLEIRSTPAGVVSHSNVPLSFGLHKSMYSVYCYLEGGILKNGDEGQRAP